MKQIGHYQVEETPIGSGGMGRVLKGVSADGRRLVAIKEILPNFVKDVEYRSRIESEINFLKKLDNDNVVKVYDHFEIGGSLYIVMELVEGLDIEKYVAQNGPIPWRDAVNYMLKLLNTMQYVHEHGIVHRDIKPGNIMIRNNGDICLLDFGVAKDVSQNGAEKKGRTVIGTIIGTDGYMSPEQAEGMSLDHRADIYALGCLFYFMLTGNHAFGNAQSEYQIAMAIQQLHSGNFPRLNKSVKNLPPAIQKITDHAVDKNMMLRYQSCRDFANDLREVISGGTPAVNTPVPQQMPNVPVVLKIGRAADNDIVIDQQYGKTSRYHAEVELKHFTGGSFYVFRDKSSNGTYINGRTYKDMTFNIPVGDSPEIYLGREMPISMQEIEEALKKKMSQYGISQPLPPPDIQASVNSGIGTINENARGKIVPPQPPRKKIDPAETFSGAIKTCFRKYAVFQGRASRSEYWWFYLFTVIINTLIGIVFIATEFDMNVLYAFWAVSLVLFLPSLAVTIRRLHDVGKSWGQLFLQLIPIVGFIFTIRMIVYLCTKGDPGANEYGMPPGN